MCYRHPPPLYSPCFCISYTAHSAWSHILGRSTLQEQQQFTATLEECNRKDPLRNGWENHVLHGLPRSCRADGVLNNLQHDLQVVAVPVQDNAPQINHFTIFGCIGMYQVTVQRSSPLEQSESRYGVDTTIQFNMQQLQSIFCQMKGKT